MPFKKVLSDLLENVPGAMGAIIADWEGEAVDHLARMDDFQLKLLGAHKGIILNNLRSVLGRLGDGDLREIIVTTEKYHTLILPLTLEYFLVLTLEREEVLGRALLEARRCVGLLRDEIA
jgi:predicted regulator of Ras-like GTPase activity (Roadblock/LC7/MglB family)